MRVLLLGDSTSFAGGYFPKAYPLFLSRKETWPVGTEIINPSVAGFTSADARLYYKNYAASSTPPDIVIIMLGNCDACKTSTPKGRPGSLVQGVHKFITNYVATKNHNLFIPNTFDAGFDASLERPESIKDFSTNLEWLVRQVARDRALPVLVSPVANSEFIAGAGKGNFIFYRKFGLRRDLPDVAYRVPADLWEAIKACRQGNEDSAIDIYMKLKNGEGSAIEVPEIREIAANNLAVLKAEGGDFAGGCSALSEQLEQSPIRPEIFRFNFARIQRACGDEITSSKSFTEAFESDSTMYRIREPYRAVIEKTSHESEDARFLDLKPHSTLDHMLDHCHPNEEGQKIWADAIASTIGDKLTGNSPAILVNCPVTPEYGLGNKSELANFLFGDFAADDKAQQTIYFVPSEI